MKKVTAGLKVARALGHATLSASTRQIEPGNKVLALREEWWTLPRKRYWDYNRVETYYKRNLSFGRDIVV